MLPMGASAIAIKIKSVKTVSRFAQEARYGQRLEASDYFSLAKRQGFSGRQSWAIARRAFLASEAQVGKCPVRSWQQDAKFTKF